MKRTLYIGFAIALLAIAIAYVKRESLYLAYLAGQIPTVSLADHQDFLEPHIEITKPETGAATYPVVIMFHGCAGFRPVFKDQWTKQITEAGYMAVAVDSLTPRGINYETSLTTVCHGTQLIGQERAGDVLAAYDLIRKRTDIDQTNIILAGWSHGAWSVMDFLTMDMARRRPAQFSANVADIPKPTAAILFYPYCGEGSRSRFANWQNPPRTLAFVAGSDSIVDGDLCLDLIASLNKRGQKIDLKYYQDAEHAFDNSALEFDFPELYNEEYAIDATKHVRKFLDEQLQ